MLTCCLLYWCHIYSVYAAVVQWKGREAWAVPAGRGGHFTHRHDKIRMLIHSWTHLVNNDFLLLFCENRPWLCYMLLLPSKQKVVYSYLFGKHGSGNPLGTLLWPLTPGCSALWKPTGRIMLNVCSKDSKGWINQPMTLSANISQQCGTSASITTAQKNKKTPTERIITSSIYNI